MDDNFREYVTFSFVVQDRFESFPSFLSRNSYPGIGLDFKRTLCFEFTHLQAHGIEAWYDLGTHARIGENVAPDGKHTESLHFKVPDDPVEAEGTPEERMAVFRRVRDQLREKIEEQFG